MPDVINAYMGDELLFGTPVEPSTWVTAFNSGSLATIRTWYEDNTGHLAEGFDEGDIWTDTDTVVIDAAWLAANEGANVVESGGRWTVTGLEALFIEVDHDDVTLSHCYVNRQGEVGGNGNGVTVADTRTGIILDHCTLDGGEGDGNETDYGDATSYYNEADHTADNFIIRYCHAVGYRAGFLSFWGTTVEYSYVHDLYIFGDSHNTSVSFRGENCLAYRSFFDDGTSSAMSFYPDYTPYTNVRAVESVFTRGGTLEAPHAAAEIQFPLRGTGYSPPSPGESRELVGNRFQIGDVTDLQYFTRTFGNKLLDDTPLFGDEGAARVVGQPCLLKYRFNDSGGGALSSQQTFYFTPTPESTLLVFVAAKQGGHTTAQNVAISVEGDDVAGQTFTKIAESTTEDYSGDLDQYGLRLTLFKAETGATTSFQRIAVDPYAGGEQVAYILMWVYEITGVTGLALEQPAVATTDHDSGFGVFITELVADPLAAPATSGNHVFAFYAAGIEADGAPGNVSGWNKTGVLSDATNQLNGAVYHRTDFTGDDITIADPGVDVGVAGVILAEFSVA